MISPPNCGLAYFAAKPSHCQEAEVANERFNGASDCMMTPVMTGPSPSFG
jgi:hypothetical protein